MKFLSLLLVMGVSSMADDARPDPMAVASKWTSITTVRGKIYDHITVTSVDAHSVHYMNDTGCGAIEMSDLRFMDQQALGYDPKAAAVAIAAEQAKEAATDIMVAKVTAQENAAKQQVSVVQAASTTKAGTSLQASSKPTLTPNQIASIQEQITSLQSDVCLMQRVEAQVYQEGDKQVVRANGRITTQGAYTQKIIDDQAQIQQLQAELK